MSPDTLKRLTSILASLVFVPLVILQKHIEDRSRFVLALISGTVALLVASPLLWIGQEALQVDPDRAWTLLTMSRTMDILIASIALMVFVTAFSILLGVPLAVLTTRTDLPFRRLWSILIALPLVVPSYIGAFAFVSAFGRHGEFGSILGVTPPRIDGFTGAVLIITLYTYPYVFLTTRAALISLDSSLVEAARTLDAGRFEAFRRVVLPQIRPGIAAGALLVALYAVSDFGTPAFMRVEVFTSVIFEEQELANLAYASLLSLQLIAVVAIILVLEAALGKEEDVASSGRAGNRMRLGYWKWPTMAGLGLLTFVTLVVPVAIFGAFLVRGTGGEAPSLAFELGYALNSVYLAALAALASCLLALPVAYYSARSGSLAARLFERITYVGFAVPGVIIGLALVFFGVTYTPALYRTSIVLLVFAYVVRFLPQAVGTTRSAVLQVDEKLPEAARTLNAGRFETFRRVTFPRIAPGVVAGGALVFLTTMKELPATLMLRPLGMDTLVTIIWSAHNEVFYAYAAIPALILILISGLSMLVLLYQEEYGLG